MTKMLIKQKLCTKYSKHQIFAIKFQFLWQLDCLLLFFHSHSATVRMFPGEPLSSIGKDSAWFLLNVYSTCYKSLYVGSCIAFKLIRNLDLDSMIYNLVANETTGKLFLDDKHFSRSINKEFDLIFKSCSSRDLFISKSWCECSASFNLRFNKS